MKQKQKTISLKTIDLENIYGGGYWERTTTIEGGVITVLLVYIR